MNRDIEKLSKHTSLVDAWGRLLSRFHWQVFVTPTFRYGVSQEQARFAVEEWIKGLGPNVFAFIAYERGIAGGRIHCHALIGGLHQGRRQRTGLDLRKIAIRFAERSWKHGNIRIDQYNPRQGAAWYVAKCPDEAEIIGALKNHRPRRGKSKNGHQPNHT